MKLTLYSALTCSACVGCIELLLIFLKKKSWIRQRDLSFVLSLYGICMVRLLFPGEFGFAWHVDAKVYNGIQLLLLKGTAIPGITVHHIVLPGWIIVALLLTLRFLATYRKAARYVKQCAVIQDETIQTELRKSNGAYKRRLHVAVRSTAELSSPMGFGLRNKSILLPDREYSDQELNHILLHECNHFYHHDLVLKAMMQLICCFWWWNPLVYLIRRGWRTRWSRGVTGMSCR